MTHPKVMIVKARCNNTKQSFGIRIEEESKGKWIANWAFPINNSIAEREGYNATNITGSFAISSAYQGCPHCEARSFVQCSCGMVSCWNGKDRTYTCSWCRKEVKINESSIQNLRAGEDI